MPGALEYLPAIEAAKATREDIPDCYRDHPLQGTARRFHSVVIGDLDISPPVGEYVPGADATFVAIYENAGNVCKVLKIVQHDDAY